MDSWFRILILTCSRCSEVEGGFLHRKKRPTNWSWSGILHIRSGNNRRGTSDYVRTGV